MLSKDNPRASLPLCVHQEQEILEIELGHPLQQGGVLAGI